MASAKQVVLPRQVLSRQVLSRQGGSEAKLKLGLPELGLPERAVCAKSSMKPVPPIEPSPPSEERLPSEASTPLGLMAGAAIALTMGITATVGQSTSPAASPPQYEGAFQIRLDAAPDQVAADQVAADQSAAPQSVSRSIAAPEVFSEAQIRLLESPRLLYPVLKQTPGLDYATLVQNLKITVNADEQLDVHYRDADAQRLQQVLQRLAQAYLRYSQACEADQCRAVAFIQEKVPTVEADIAHLSAQMQQLDQQNGVEDIAEQTRLFEVRSVELGKQKADIDVELVHTLEQFKALQQQLELPDDEAIAITLLGQDEEYQALLPDLQAIDRQIATELSQFQVSSPNLEALYAQHQVVQQQLYQVSQQVLDRYLARSDANPNSPVFQTPQSLDLLRQSIESAHYLKVLQIRQETIAQTDELVKQQCYKLAELLRQHDALQQQLDSKTQILQIYQEQLMLLQHSIAQFAALPVWTLAAQPHLVSSESSFHLPQFLTLKPAELSEMNALIGALLGLGTAVVVGATTQNKGRWQLKPSSPQSQPVALG